jgi:hypothetical protein
MPAFTRKYCDQIIIALIGIIAILLWILFTDLHLEGISREMDQTIRQHT